MKKFFPIIFLSLWVLFANAQDYLINFSGTGSSTTVETITVENLTQGKSITFEGSKTLHLMGTVTGNSPLLEYIDYPMIVYPNPSSGDFTVQFDAQKSGMVSVSIYDMSGREINKRQERIRNGFQSFKVTGLGNGVYTVQVLVDDQMFTQKVVCNSKSTLIPSISYNGFSEAKQKGAVLKNATTEQAWQYNTGDRLKFQGTSGKYSTIVMDVPIQSKTLSFDFVECTDADGNNYPVVKIGNQLWMAENLKTTKYNDGTPILNETDNLKWTNMTDGAYCWYNNDINNKSIHGALYNWFAVESKKLAPIGWEVPTTSEWTEVFSYLGGESTSGGKLKEINTKNWASPNTGATNEVGFTGLPGGIRLVNKENSLLGSFSIIGAFGYWWSSKIDNSTSLGNAIELGYYFASINSVDREKQTGCSIRCIRNFLPKLSTAEGINITETSAIFGGNISYDGGAPITARGVCWSIFQNPTISDNKTIDGSGTGNFTSLISGLNVGSCYYIRAYATNKFGTTYGNQVTTLCPETYSSKTSIIDLSVTGLSNGNINIGVNGSVAGTLVYKKDGVENMIITPTLFFNEPLLPAIHLVKKSESWVYEGNYPEGSMGAARNYDFLDNNGTIAFSDHGLELREGTWPFGNLVVARTTGDKLIWTTVSNDRSFYHSVSTGDINNDGLTDIVGLHMGTKGSWTSDDLHTYIQNKDGSFSENRNIISLSKVPGNYGGGAVLVTDLFGDSAPEIIKADYGQNPTYPSPRYSFAIFSFDKNTGYYELTKSPGPIGVFKNPDRGATSIKAADFDKDGDLDLAVATEGTDFNGIEIWINDGVGNFTPSDQKLEFTPADMQFREFQVMDVDNDGYLDIVLNPFHYGKLFRINPTGENLEETVGIMLHNLIWKNSSGNFSLLKKEIIVHNVTPSFVKAFKINGKLTFICIEGMQNGSIITITEIEPHLN